MRRGNINGRVTFVEEIPPKRKRGRRPGKISSKYDNIIMYRHFIMY